MTDEQLIEKIRLGDEDAEHELFEKYKNYVRKICRGYYIVGGEIEDLIQEGMIGFYKALKSFNCEKEILFKTFAVTCIKRQIHSAIKKANTKKNQPLSTAVSLYSFDKEHESLDYLPLELVLDITPADQVINAEDLIKLKNDINEILSKFEMDVLKQYLQGYEYLEIANNFNTSKRSIDNALTRIRAKLRKQLNKDF